MAFRNNFGDSVVTPVRARMQTGIMKSDTCLRSIFHEKRGTASVRELCGWKGLSAHIGRERELLHMFPHPPSIAIRPYMCTRIIICTCR